MVQDRLPERLRVGHAERDAVASILQDAAAEGRISMDELDDRLGKSMGTKTIKVPATPTPGQPLLVLYGSVGLGSLKVRPGSGRELRRATG